MRLSESVRHRYISLRSASIDAALARQWQVLWKVSRQYYEGRAGEAWSSGDVPYWITSSAQMARFYTELIWQYFFLSCLGRLDCNNSAPFYVLEVPWRAPC